jgi:UDP-N-acetylmuramoyl-tripeptide--D-alanyl-D-alanine ligase
MNIKELHTLFLKHNTIATDTRTIKEGALFFALKGANFNGNTFAEQAIAKGATYAIIDEPAYQNTHTIVVDNVLSTLQKLAHYHRNTLEIPILALTGSNGKTTTKELINAVLSQKYKTAATAGNLNNHIGVPLTLLRMDSATEIGIVEMGANHLKEIDFLCAIAAPDYGYITNFGKAHLEGFGSLEGVIKGKSEMYDYLREHQKTVFVNASDEKQLERTKDIKQFSFSDNHHSDVSISFEAANPNVSLKHDGKRINTQLIGAYNFSNIAAAIAIGTYFNVPQEAIKNALEHYVPTNNRSQVLIKKSNKIILDAYNANPTSMQAALNNLSGLADKNKIAILGDMFELGTASKEEHQAIVNYLEQSDFKEIYLIGTHFSKTKHSKRIKTFPSFNPENIQLKHLFDATILIKGSRGVALERILEIL